MPGSLVATSITIHEVVGSVLIGASMTLTTHSLFRMVFMRRTGSKYHLFPIINIAQLVNQFCILFLLTTAFGTISLHIALWLNIINHFAYFITKPMALYLAYLRCSAVFSPFTRANPLHFSLISMRVVELFVILVVSIIQNYKCDGSVAKGTKCEGLAIAWLVRDVFAPLFRFYYIMCEAIFYVKLFRTLTSMSSSNSVPLIQYRRLQTTLFTADLIILIFMSIYRVIGIFNPSLPTYVYYELFSSTLTIFNLTEFGLQLRVLFNQVADPHVSMNDISAITAKQSGSTALGSRNQGTNRGTDHNSHNIKLYSELSGTPAAEADYDLLAVAGSSSEYPEYIPYRPPDTSSPRRNHSSNGGSNGNNNETRRPDLSTASISELCQESHIITSLRFQSQTQSGMDKVTVPMTVATPEKVNVMQAIQRPSPAFIVTHYGSNT